jgi:hypothetical protein
MIHKTLHRKLKIEQQEPNKTGDKLECSGRVSCFCSTSSVSHVTIVKNPVISHDGGKDCDYNKQKISVAICHTVMTSNLTTRTSWFSNLLSRIS